MRVQPVNKSSRPDVDVLPLAMYAASFFPHRSGAVPVEIKNSRRGRPHGICRGGGRRCVVWIEREGEQKYPQTFDKMHYFRHASVDVLPLTVNSWQEWCLSIIAHELEHTTKGNRLMRRSRQEKHAWNRSVEVVEASRTPEGQAIIAAFTEEIRQRSDRQEKTVEFKKSPQAKAARVDKLLTKWQRKLKLAQTKIRKLRTRQKYFEKKIAASGTV